MTLSLMFSGADDTPLNRFQWSRGAVRWADEIGPLGRTAIKAKAPVSKGPNGGRLRDSIRYIRSTSVGAGISVSFVSTAPYTKFVIGGTAPHIIEARAAKSLHWVDSSGHSNFRRLVHHPGTRPNPFPEKALLPLVPFMQKRFAEIMSEQFTRG